MNRSLDHIVHIGAGAGRDLPVYLEAGAVTLVEADPDAAAQLGAVAQDHPQVTVIEAAVSADLRERAFRQTNFPELNSFRKPTGLKELFPGLRILSEERVKPLDPVRLIQDIALSRDDANLLVIEAPGEALGILKALDNAGLLLNFEEIRVQEALESLYHQAPVAEDIRAFLGEAGYSAGFEPAPEDPDRPYLEARLDRAALENCRRIAELTEALAGAQSQIEALKGARDAAIRQVEAVRGELSERDIQIEALKRARDAVQDKVTQAEEAQKTAEYRLHQSREEMLKAEGQIGLIRDLLLNGPAL